MNLNFAEKAIFLRFERISQIFCKIYCVCEEKVVSLHALCVSITSKTSWASRTSITSSASKTSDRNRKLIKYQTYGRFKSTSRTTREV